MRGGIASGSLVPGKQLPPAAELAEALSVDRNTVLAAYRQLRADGLLEFRRGRGARVAKEPRPLEGHTSMRLSSTRRASLSRPHAAMDSNATT